MRADEVLDVLNRVGRSWTKQIKAEERNAQARERRESMYAPQRVSLKSICWENMEEAWNHASDDGRLPTHWRQVFYVMREHVYADADADRALRDTTFKAILEEYLDVEQPDWDILRGARGSFKEPHQGGGGLAMSTLGVRNYLNADPGDGALTEISSRYPTVGAADRFGAVLICEKEGFDELLNAEQIPKRFDLALMSTKGISAFAARDLAEALGVPCFTLHDLDKNGFVMASGFTGAIDLGLRMEDVHALDLSSESQVHDNQERTYANLIDNGASPEEAEFVAFEERRVELNMLTSPEFIEFVTSKLSEHGVEKIVPDADTLERAWTRAHEVRLVNATIAYRRDPQGEAPDLDAEIPAPPDDLAEQIRRAFQEDDSRSWDDVLFHIVTKEDEDTSSETKRCSGGCDGLSSQASVPTIDPAVASTIPTPSRIAPLSRSERNRSRRFLDGSSSSLLPART